MSDQIEGDFKRDMLPWRKTILLAVPVLILLVVYAAMPLDTEAVGILSMVLFFFGILLFSVVVISVFLHEVHENARLDVRVRSVSLILVIVGSVGFFAIAYHRVASVPGQFSGLNTWLDAVYFTVSTSLTVGFGDIFASGQFSRFQVLVQMLYTVIILATAGRLVGGLFRKTAAQRNK